MISALTGGTVIGWMYLRVSAVRLSLYPFAMFMGLKSFVLVKKE